MSKSTHEKYLQRPPSLSDEIPFEDFIEEHRLFTMCDGSLGVVFEIDLLEHEAMTEEQVLESVRSLKSWFTLPDSVSLQVIFDQSPVSGNDPVFAEWETAHSNGHPLSKTLFKERLQHLQLGTIAQTPTLKRRGLLSIRFFPERKRQSKPLQFFADPNVTLLEQAKFAAADVEEFLQIVRSFEANSSLRLKRLDADDLIYILRKFFNPVSIYQRGFQPYNSQVPINEQVLFNSPTISFSGIEREGIKSRTISLKTSPNFVYPGGAAYFTTLKFPFRVAVNYSFPTRAKVKKFFALKEFFLENTPSARAKRQKEDLESVQHKLVRDDRCLHMSFHITIEGQSDEELDQRTRDVAGILQNQLSCEYIVEDDIGAGLALNSLPLFYSPRSDLSARRYIRILRSDAVMLVPMFDSFKGLSNPLQVYVSREGNPVKFSLFENETSNHTVVLADTGSGKSSFVIDCVQSAKRMSPEPLVFVIDKKSSYTMLANYFDADITVFGHGEKIPFSPFRGKFDDEKLRFLTHLAGTAIKLLSPTFPLDSSHTAAIQKAIALAHKRKVREQRVVLKNGNLMESDTPIDSTLTMDDVISELASLTSLEEFEHSSDMIDELIQKLSPLYGDGVYAKYFNSQVATKSESGKLFYIYDLDALDGDPTLQCLMTMSVVEEIRQKINQHRDDGRMGIVVLEELQMLARGNSIGKQFVLDAAETFRKLGVWLISLTPRPQNYFETEVGKAMWGVADNFVFMQMSSDNVDYVSKNSSILNQAGIEIVKSLQTVRDSHADVFFINKKRTRQGAFRFFQTAYDRWLAPTNAESARIARSAIERSPDCKWQALERLVSQYPTGSHHA